MLTKTDIRKVFLKKRDSYAINELMRKSEKIKNNLFCLKEFANAETILFYVSKNKEVRTDDMIKQSIKMGKKTLVPYINKKSNEIIPSKIINFDKELEMGSFGIREPKKMFRRPVNPEIIDMVIVPGIVFDRRGYRIGYGKGFYDKFLSKIRCETIGLAYSFQIIDMIPNEEHDIPIKTIITENGFIICNNFLIKK